MSSGDPSTPHPSTLPTASGTVTKGSELDKAIQTACESLKLIFKAEDSDDATQENLSMARTVVRKTIKAVDPTRKKRLRTESDFESHVKAGSNEERNLVNLLGRMAKGQVPWKDLFLYGTLFSSL